MALARLYFVCIRIERTAATNNQRSVEPDKHGNCVYGSELTTGSSLHTFLPRRWSTHLGVNVHPLHSAGRRDGL